MTEIASAPVGREFAVGNDQFAHHRVVDDRQELILGADVVVERHRPGIEFQRQTPHRQCVETLLVGDLDRCCGDLVPSELGAPRPWFGPCPHVVRGDARGEILEQRGLAGELGRRLVDLGTESIGNLFDFAGRLLRRCCVGTLVRRNAMGV